MIRGHNCLPNGLTKCHKLPSNPPTKIPTNKIQTIIHRGGGKGKKNSNKKVKSRF